LKIILKSIHIKKNEIEESIVVYNLDIENINKQLIEKQESLNKNKNHLNEKKDELTKNRLEFKTLNENFNSEQQIISTIQNEITNNNKSVTNINNLISKLDNNIQHLTSNIAKSVGYLEDLENEKEQIETKLRDSEEKYIRNSEIKEKLETEISELRVKELEIFVPGTIPKSNNRLLCCPRQVGETWITSASSPGFRSINVFIFSFTKSLSGRISTETFDAINGVSTLSSPSAATTILSSDL